MYSPLLLVLLYFRSSYYCIQNWNKFFFSNLDNDLKIYSTERMSWLPIPRLNESFLSMTTKKTVWHKSKEKAKRNSILGRKRAHLNEGPSDKSNSRDENGPKDRLFYFIFTTNVRLLMRSISNLNKFNQYTSNTIYFISFWLSFLAYLVKNTIFFLFW